jgi:hypothetical protein
MLNRRTLLATLAAVAAAGAAHAQTTPPRGSPLRAQLLDAIRPEHEKEIGGKIEFQVLAMRVMEPWAYLHVRPTRPGGKAIDWTRTKFAEDMKEGMMSHESMALLKQDGARWTVAEIAIGPSDVAWDGWRQERNLPKKLFTDE